MTVLTSLKNNVPASQTGMQDYIDWAFQPHTSFIEGIENEDFPNFSHNYRECDVVVSRSSLKTVLQIFVLIRMKLEDTTVKNFDQPTIHWNNSADDNDYCFKHCDHVAVMCPCNDDDCSCYVVRSFCFDVDGCYTGMNQSYNKNFICFIMYIQYSLIILECLLL
ncbi:hypothetical protein D917_05184 [Trichinella nativa]|uniref:Uncharacterized protein n=1 Tax=Trichinella nativa TaxID=6335 RepID=A0A1Y3EXY5_9BILA|nr:hypothetical protein D917_05184 [Trichinella nativa]